MIRHTLLLLVLIALATLAGSSAARADDPPAVVCDVEPRTDAEIADLLAAATPEAATPTPSETNGWPPEGTPADDATRAELQATMEQAQACDEAGDRLRLLALFSDAFLRAHAGASWLVPATPGAEVPAIYETPVLRDGAGNVPTIAEAVVTADGRVAALAEGADGWSAIVWFVQEGGRMRIDAYGSAAEIPAGAEAAVQAAILAAAADAGVDPSAVRVVGVEAVDWPDAAIGCPEPGMVYAQVITPGWRIELAIGGTRVVYHANETGSQIATCAEA